MYLKQKKNQKKKIFWTYWEWNRRYWLYFVYFFDFLKLSYLAKKLFEIKAKKKNNDFVKEIKNRWSKLKDEIEKVFDDEKNKIKS